MVVHIIAHANTHFKTGCAWIGFRVARGTISEKGISCSDSEEITVAGSLIRFPLLSLNVMKRLYEIDRKGKIAKHYEQLKLSFSSEKNLHYTFVKNRKDHQSLGS
jgi:hypothetical protein